LICQTNRRTRRAQRRSCAFRSRPVSQHSSAATQPRSMTRTSTLSPSLYDARCCAARYRLSALAKPNIAEIIKTRAFAQLAHGRNDPNSCRNRCSAAKGRFVPPTVIGGSVTLMVIARCGAAGAHLDWLEPKPGQREIDAGDHRCDWSRPQPTRPDAVCPAVGQGRGDNAEYERSDCGRCRQTIPMHSG
jgi:hypothetical protein